MDIGQYQSIKLILTSAPVSPEAGELDLMESQINGIFSTPTKAININVLGDALSIAKDVLNSNREPQITVGTHESTVTIGDSTHTGPRFGITFITALMMEIEHRSLQTFLATPNNKTDASSAKRDGLASPAPTRSLPVRKGNY